jgi:aspartyl-tRNA synthetase
MAGVESIRDVIAFPKTASGGDPLTGAPSPITAAQRAEAGVDAPPARDDKVSGSSASGQ